MSILDAIILGIVEGITEFLPISSTGHMDLTADMVEATEFPHLAMKYQVQGVPRTVINELTHVEGAVPEAALVSRLMASFGSRLA